MDSITVYKERHVVAQRQVYIGRVRLLSDVHILHKLVLGDNSHVAVAGHCSQGIPDDPEQPDTPAVPPNPASPIAVIGSFGVDQVCFWGGILLWNLQLKACLTSTGIMQQT